MLETVFFYYFFKNSLTIEINHEIILLLYISIVEVLDERKCVW